MRQTGGTRRNGTKCLLLAVIFLHLKNILKRKKSECYMSGSATFLAKGKLRPISGLTESRVQAWGGHQPSRQAFAGPVLGCSEQHGLGPCSRGWFPGGWGQAGCYERTVLIFPLVSS